MARTKLTPRARAKFMEALGCERSVEAAARKAGITRQYAYEVRSQDPQFAADWDAARKVFNDLLLEEAIRRSYGVEREVHDKNGNVLLDEDGNPRTVTEASDFLMGKLLDIHFGSKVRQEHTGKDGAPIEHSVSGTLTFAERMRALAELAGPGNDPAGD